MHHQHHLSYLLQQYISGTASEEELSELSDRLNQQPDNADARALLDSHFPQSQASPLYDGQRLQTILEQIRKTDMAKTPTAPVKRLRPGWGRYAAAAAVVLVIGTGLYFGLTHREKAIPAVSAAMAVKKDVAPGKNGAILTLADGHRVVLDSAGNGWTVDQNGSRVVLDQGKLSYKATTAGEGAVVYNTMETPKARQFHLLLPDGTAVWLNAASSIRYPTTFTGNERKVEIRGEAYLEVAKDAARPFRVSIHGGRTTIEVLGTRFNVNAYADEPVVRTTLLQGAVSVKSERASQVLAPGEQATVSASGAVQWQKTVDTSQAIAWKNGSFNFQDRPLTEVMRQLSRWYDIEVVYDKDIPDIEFFGEMGRNLTLEQLLEGLKGTGVNFKIEGRRLLVMP